MTTPYIVGITGGSASGKTLLLNELRKPFKDDELCVLSQDNYYRPMQEQLVDDHGVENFDIPSSIDHEAFARDIARLKRGETVELYEYTFNKANQEPKVLVHKPAPIIVIEGIFVFYYQEVVDQLDLKVFVDAREYLMIKRRILRDAKERGYDLDDVLYRFENHIMPAYKKYIKPFKHDSDIIIPNNNDSFKNGLGVLTGFLKGKI
ncbi:uridine kinase [Reichenbachiella carrageenanivorans]|uniref:Uridine kinase n=1 Tax=Reichenbachiella carrageenanivorans TaxID=2979869 RepID=A0ABY6D407_9BACT|nr:uridine kinase [Reichenbachiella carrageenanivorans]UXX80872.1 uridine kinase [Reichenbachiella carrageenanivorans]